MSSRREHDEHDDFRAFEAQFDPSSGRSIDDEFAALDRHGLVGASASFEDEFDPDLLDELDDAGYRPIPRSRAVRWTAILVVASFALGALFSVLRFL